MNAALPLKVLVIECPSDAPDVIEHALRSFGHTVHVVLAPDEAAARSALQARDIPLIFCDAADAAVPLARVASLQRKHAPEAAVLALGDRIDGSTVAAAMRAGAVDLVYPDERAHLKAVVDRELARYRAAVSTADAEALSHDTEAGWLALLDTVQEPIAFLHQGLHVHANAAYLNLLGLTEADEVVGLSLLDTVAREHHAQLRPQLRDDALRDAAVDLQFQTQAGDTVAASAVFTPARFQDESCLCLTVRTGAAPAAEAAAGDGGDRLTGLPGPDALVATLTDTLAADATGHSLWYVTLGDVDALAPDGDRLDAEAALVQTAEWLRAECAGARTVAWVAAADFAVLWADPAEGSGDAAEQLRTALAGRLATVDQPPAVAALPLDHLGQRTGEDVLAQARALSHDAHRRQNGAAEIAPEAAPGDGAAPCAVTDGTEAQLVCALDQDRIRPHFRPITALRGAGMEAYDVRPQVVDADGAPVETEETLSNLGNPSLIAALDRRMLERTLDVLTQEWSPERSLTLFLTLDIATLRDEELLNGVAERLKQARVPAGHLVLALNAAAHTAHAEEARLIAKRVRAAGGAFAVTDLDETALSADSYACAEYLGLAPRLVQRLGDSAKHQEAVRTVCNTVQETQQRLIALGVENAQCLSFLWQVGADYAQGDFLQESVDTLELDFASA